MINTIELLEEDDVTIEIKDFTIVVKHNNIGISIDFYQGDECIGGNQYYFDDLKLDNENS